MNIQNNANATLERINHAVTYTGNIQELKYSDQQVLKDLLLLETEVKNAYRLFKENKLFYNQKEHQNTLFFLYYCAKLLAMYYQRYGKKLSEQQYKNYAEELCQFLDPENYPQVRGNTTFWHDACNGTSDKTLHLIAGDFVNLAASFIKLTAVKGHISQINFYRIYWSFCKLVTQSLLMFTHELKILEKFDTAFFEQFNMHCSLFDNLMNVMNNQVLTDSLYVMSVGFYAVRILIDAVLVVKHVLFHEQENDDSTKWTRFKQEMEKRGLDILDNLVWGSINFITNYNDLVHISAFIANWIVAGVLTFDVMLLCVRWCIDSKKNDKCIQEIKDRNQALHEEYYTANDDRKMQIVRELEELDRKKEMLDDEWDVKCSVYRFNIAAALLLFSSFTVSLVVTGPLGIACFGVCVLACAIYASAGTWEQLQTKRVALARAEKLSYSTNERAVEKQKAITEANKAYYKEMGNFGLKIAQNLIVPSLIIASYGVCWPAALALTVIFMAYKVGKYIKEKNNIAKQNAQNNQIIYNDTKPQFYPLTSAPA